MNNTSSRDEVVDHCLESIAAPPVISRIPADEIPARKPWGFWATMGWSLLITMIGLAAIVAVVSVILVLALVSKPGLDVEAYIDEISETGWLFAIAYIVLSFAVCGFIVLAVVARRYPIGQYLALCMPNRRQLALWSLAMVGFIVVSDLISWLLGRPVVPQVMVDIYETAGILPLLLFALIVAAPITEELFFRGFMFTGLAGSTIKNVGAILITSLIWAVGHAQYDWYGILTIFLMGLTLGVCRWLAKSTVLTMVLHAIANTVATAEVMVVAHWLQ